MPIALFKLPHLVWIPVIKSMNLLELVAMSKTSARTRRVTGGYTKLHIVNVGIIRAFTDAVSVKFGSNGENMAEWAQNWDADANIEEMVRNKITFLADTFNVASISFRFVYSDTEHCCQLLEHARSLGLRFERVHYYGLLESFRRFIDVCRNATTIQLEISYNTLSPVDQNEWKNNISALLDCSTVSISCPHVSDEVLNRIIENWMQGTGRIQKFEITWMSMARRGIGAWQVQRQDGTRARIETGFRRFTFTVIID